MPLPIGVIAFYGVLVVWMALLVIGFRRRAYRAFLIFGVALMVVLNARYFTEGAADSIAFFVGIYDVLDNLGVADPAQATALVTCPDNQCSVWGDRYQYHPSWGVAFHERFMQDNQLRANLLYGHVLFISLAFVVMMVQIFRPGNGKNPGQHRALGYVSLTSLTIGVVCSCLLAAEHGSVDHYGGNLSTFGFWFMAFCVYGCAIMGLVRIRKRDFIGHQKWMFRYAGSMWGAFWLFRVMEFVLGPLLRNYDTVSILICIWFSAPLGILIAEIIRHRSVRAKKPSPVQGLESAVVTS